MTTLQMNHMTAHRIIRAVTAAFQVTDAELYGGSRTAEVASARLAASYFLQTHAGERPSLVAKRFNRTREWASWCRKELPSRIKVDKPYARKIASIGLHAEVAA